MKKNKSIALVISGGGVKTVSILPLLEKLKENNIDIETIYCCGSSSILLSLYYMGTPIEEIPDKMSELLSNKLLYNKKNISSFINFLPFSNREHLPSDSVFKNKKLLSHYNQTFEGFSIEDLPQKMVIQTTKLDTSEGYLLKEGPLAEALYASCALFPLQPPIQIQDQWLVGGVYSHHLPLLPAVHDSDYDVIVSVDFEANRRLPENNFFDYYINLIQRAMGATQKNQQTLAVLLNEQTEFIFIEVPFLRSLIYCDKEHIPYILARGEKCCRESMPNILKALKLPNRT